MSVGDIVIVALLVGICLFAVFAKPPHGTLSSLTMTNAQARKIGWFGQQSKNVVDGTIKVQEDGRDVLVSWTCRAGSFTDRIKPNGDRVVERYRPGVVQRVGR